MFIESVGNSTTSARIAGRKLGRYVNAAAYSHKGGVRLKLENMGEPVKGVSYINMTAEQYAAFCEPTSRPLFVRGIELFGAEVLL